MRVTHNLKKEKYVDKIVKELYFDSLKTTESLNSAMTTSRVVESRTREMGNDIIRFIIKKYSSHLLDKFFRSNRKWTSPWISDFRLDSSNT